MSAVLPRVSPHPAPRVIAAVLLALYAFVIARLTLTDPSTMSWAFSLADRLASSASSGQLQWTQTEVLANVALFVPAGFLLTFVLGRAWLSAVVCVAISATIEFIQLRYLPTRVASGADILHNGYGGALGAALGAIAVRLPFLGTRVRG